jgi:hypothetical protein
MSLIATPPDPPEAICSAGIAVSLGTKTRQHPLVLGLGVPAYVSGASGGAAAA